MRKRLERFPVAVILAVGILALLQGCGGATGEDTNRQAGTKTGTFISRMADTGITRSGRLLACAVGLKGEFTAVLEDTRNGTLGSFKGDLSPGGEVFGIMSFPGQEPANVRGSLTEVAPFSFQGGTAVIRDDRVVGSLTLLFEKDVLVGRFRGSYTGTYEGPGAEKGAVAFTIGADGALSGTMTPDGGAAEPISGGVDGPGGIAFLRTSPGGTVMVFGNSTLSSGTGVFRGDVQAFPPAVPVDPIVIRANRS